MTEDNGEINYAPTATVSLRLGELRQCERWRLFTRKWINKALEKGHTIKQIVNRHQSNIIIYRNHWITAVFGLEMKSKTNGQALPHGSVKKDVM